jgi:hypothetical protein
MKGIFTIPSRMQFVPLPSPDYEGIAKVMAQLVELYKVCDNKELLDSILKSLTESKMCNAESVLSVKI